MKSDKRSELCGAFAEWMGEWTFTAFLTLSVPYGVRGHREIPLTMQTRLDGYLGRFEMDRGEQVGALGACTLSRAGYLHAHVVALKERREPFSEDELAWLERKWPHNADARAITSLAPLLGYIASEKHIVTCKVWEPIVCGGDTLKALRNRKREVRPILKQSDSGEHDLAEAGAGSVAGAGTERGAVPAGGSGAHHER